MKKIITMAFCLILVLSLGACGTKNAGNGTPVATGSDMPEKGDVKDAETNTSEEVDPAMPRPNENENENGTASAGSSVVDTDDANIRTDVCELYLLVLEDLWNVDPGLNDSISQIGFDLSELSHLTELEKETMMQEFASKHDLPFIAGTWEELCEQGYIDKENLYWEDGLFFSIKTNSKLTEFDAQKWRSGLGAYFFGQCTAQKNKDGTWSYTVGQEAIS